MNKLIGIIASIETEKSLSIVNMRVGKTAMKTIVIANTNTEDYLIPGKKVQLLFKETEVVISKMLDIPISLRNQLVCQIQAIEQGKLLSKLLLTFDDRKIQSIITTASVNLLNLRVGDTVLAMIKTNEIMLASC